MTSIPHTPIGGRTMRVTRLTTFGQVVTGACNQVTSTGWATVTLTDHVTAPARYDIRPGGPAGGCLAARTKPLLDWVDVVIDFVRVDPDIITLITGAAGVTDASGATVGFGGDTGTYATGQVGFELWTGVAGQVSCPARWGYHLLPWLAGATHGPVTHNPGTVTFRVVGATVLGNRWGSGPYNVVANASGVAVPLLSPVPTSRHRHWQVTTVAPPAAVTGCQAV